MLDVEASLVAAQNALTVNPPIREPQKQAESREQQTQRQQTDLPLAQVVVRQGSAQAFEQADKFQQRQQASYDQPSNRAREAISAYQSLSNEQQRSEIQQLFGVDIYA